MDDFLLGILLLLHQGLRGVYILPSWRASRMRSQLMIGVDIMFRCKVSEATSMTGSHVSVPDDSIRIGNMVLGLEFRLESSFLTTCLRLMMCLSR